MSKYYADILSYYKKVFKQLPNEKDGATPPFLTLLAKKLLLLLIAQLSAILFV